MGYSPWGRNESDTTERLSTARTLSGTSLKATKTKLLQNDLKWLALINYIVGGSTGVIIL